VAYTRLTESEKVDAGLTGCRSSVIRVEKVIGPIWALPGAVAGGAVGVGVRGTGEGVAEGTGVAGEVAGFGVAVARGAVVALAGGTVKVATSLTWLLVGGGCVSVGGLGSSVGATAVAVAGTGDGAIAIAWVGLSDGGNAGTGI
jgi:hypothetical protein